MAQPVYAIDRIQVDVSGIFTTHHRFLTGAGELGEFTITTLSKKDVFRATGGDELWAVRTSWWRGEYELRRGGAALALAQTRGFFRSEIALQFGARRYTLERLGFFNRGWRLVDEGRMALLEVYPQGVFKRGAFLEILGEIDAALLVFSYYLVYVRWQEETAAVAAAS
jgi:hypothetical protein